MWFGVAPAPAPSPRTNTQAFHPPHCSCARHGGKLAAPTSPRARDSTPSRDQPSHRINNPVLGWTQQERTPRHAVRLAHSPRAFGANLSAGRSVETVIGTHPRSVVVNRVGVNEEDFTALEALDHRSRVGRLSRRLSKHRSPQGDGGVTTTNEFQINPIDGENDARCAFVSASSDCVERGSRLPMVSMRSRSREGTVSGLLRPRSGRMMPADGDIDSRATSPLSGELFPALPAPIKSRRSSRGHSRGGERSTHMASGTASQKPSQLGATEESIFLPPPMTERPQPMNLVGHTSSVGVVLVDDESFIVSCSIDGSVKVWSRLTHECLYTLYGHDDAVSSVDLSPEWLVSGSHDTTLRVYERAHGFRFIHALEGHSGHVTRVELVGHHQPAHAVISCSDDATLRLWGVERGDCLAVFKAHLSRITCLLVLPLPIGIICSGSADASVCFWDVAPIPDRTQSTLQPPALPQCCTASRTFRAHKSTVQSLLSGSSVIDFNKGAGSTGSFGHLVFSCSNDGTIQWFDVLTREHLGCLDSVRSPVYSMALHPTLGFLVCSTGDGRLLVYSDLTTGKGRDVTKRELKVAPKWISSLQLLRGRLLACASEGDLYVVNLERPRTERIIATVHGFLNCVRWLKPERLVTSGEDNVIKVWPIL